MPCVARALVQVVRRDDRDAERDVLSRCLMGAAWDAVSRRARPWTDP